MDTAHLSHLLAPLTLGSLQMPNRIVMAPLTRLRAPTGVPGAMMAQYYAQRASAGLIITEGVPISPDAVGYPNVPGLWSREQVDGWRGVTEAVHQAGGRIFAQIWHVGRITHPDRLDGQWPVGPSAIAAEGTVAFSRPKLPYVVPRPLHREEIHAIVQAFGRAARNAQAAGFDGVTLHAANGYLLDQFLQDGSNRRSDEYGGSVENRARLLLGVADAVTSVWGPQRVGVHLATRSPNHGISDSDPARIFGHVARELGKRSVGFLFVREAPGPGALLHRLKQEFGGAIIANDGFDAQTGDAAIRKGDADAIGFGRAYIANPDLVERLRSGAALNAGDAETIYGAFDASPNPRGYIDYPTLAG